MKKRKKEKKQSTYFSLFKRVRLKTFGCLHEHEYYVVIFLYLLDEEEEEEEGLFCPMETNMYIVSGNDTHASLRISQHQFDAKSIYCI